MLSRIACRVGRKASDITACNVRIQSTVAGTMKKRPCGKCIRCSCLGNGRGGGATAATPGATLAPARLQSTAPAVKIQEPTAFEQYEGRPAWIKDPTHPLGLDITDVKVNNAEDKCWLEMTWGDGNRTLHPYLWLRDNCTCPECFHPTTLSRRFLMKNLDTNITPLKTEIDQAERRVYVDWSDGHASVYPFSWLEGRNFTQEASQDREKWLPRQHTYWGEELQDNVPSESFENIMNDEKALFNWIVTLEEKGIFRVQNAPQTGGILPLFAKRIGFLKPTHFGELWEVRTRFNPSNLQYTTATLGLHIDLTYYDYTPGVQMLHCIKQAQSEGGDNQFVDGFHISERMKNEQPENYKLLTEVLIDHYDLGEEQDGKKFFKLQRQPVIRLDRDGKFERITYNNMVRDSVLCAPVEKINPLYKAMKAFDDMLHDPQSHITYKMDPGDIICFHNYRVMHGRSGYQQLQPGDRHLQGGFIDWDEMHCKRRVLQMTNGLQP